MGLIFAALTEQPAALRVAAATCKQWRQHAKDVGLLMHLVGSTPGNRHSGYLGTYIICNTFFHGRPSYVQLGDPGKMLWYSRKAGWFAGITPEAGKGRGRLCNDSYALAPQLITTPWEIQALPAVGGWEAAAGLRSGIDAEAELEASQHRKAADAQRAASAEMIYITSARGALTGLAAKCVGAFSRIPGAQYNWRPAYLKQRSSKIALWYDGRCWVGGAREELGRATGYLAAQDDAVAPELIAAPWQAFDSAAAGERWPEAPSVRCVTFGDGGLTPRRSQRSPGTQTPLRSR